MFVVNRSGQAGAFSGNKATHLSENADNCCLPKHRAFAAHVRTGDYQQPVGRVVEVQIVGDEGLLAEDFNNSVATLNYFHLIAIVHDRSHVTKTR